MLFNLFKGLLTITRREDLVAFKLEITHDQAEQLRIIIGSQDGCFLHRHGAYSPLMYSCTCQRCQTLFFFTGREPHMKRTATAWATLGPDDALMELDNTLTNRQAQAETVDLAGQTRIHPMKAFKDTIKVFRGPRIAQQAEESGEDGLSSGLKRLCSH
jgi:hypothetical protein